MYRKQLFGMLLAAAVLCSSCVSIAEVSDTDSGSVTDTSVCNIPDSSEVSLPVEDSSVCDISDELSEDASDDTEDIVSEVSEADFTFEVIDGVTYINGILLVNKSYLLPESYSPGGLLPEVKSAFDDMVAAAAGDGIKLYVVSGFRSYGTQEYLYESYLKRDPQETVDTYSARPGASEHQTGMAIDVNRCSSSFAGTPEAIWLAEHCAEYGFIVRYPLGKESITGYKYEPWHIRYIGDTDLAAYLMENDICLEEYLNVTSVYNIEYKY